MSAGRWFNVQPCPSPAAWKRHHARGEPVDPACRQLYNDEAARRRAQRREWLLRKAARR